MTDKVCKHEVRKDAQTLFAEGTTDRVQCLKCKTPLTKDQLGKPNESKNEKQK